MDNENMTSAELAREERKARIEKTTKTQAEKKEKKASTSATKRRLKIIIPVVIVVLALAIALCIFFGVPQRVFSAVKFSDGSKVSVAEYEYYYKAIYNNYYQQAMQYEQYYGAYYGEGAGKTMTGFDYTKTPAAQEYTSTDKELMKDMTEKYGKKPTWADFIEKTTVETCQAFNAFGAAAKAEKISLTKDEQKEINNYIEDIRKEAAKSNYSLDAYLREFYGRGMTAKIFRQIMEKQQIVSKYLDTKQNEYRDAVTEKQINDAYAKDPMKYQQVSLRCFSISSKVAESTEKKKLTNDELNAQTKKNNEEKIALADKFLNEATGQNFTALTEKYAEEGEKANYKDDTYSKLNDASYSSIETYFGKEGVDWAFNKDRKVDDKTLIKTENEDGSVTLTILLLTSLPERDDTYQPVSVRHVLVGLDKTEVDPTTGENKKTPLRSKEEALKLAEDYLDSWVKGGAKEDAFIKLANEKSDDPGSSDNGGLYEDVTKTSNYVEPFLNWCFEQGRKVGDYGIVETDYGYHIMYMSKIPETTIWQSTIKEALATEAFNAYYTQISTDKKYTPSLSNFFAKKTRNKVEDYATQIIAKSNTAEGVAAQQFAQ